MTFTPSTVDFWRRRLGYQFPPLGRKAFRIFFKLLPPEIETELFPGIRVLMNLRDETQQAAYWRGMRFERPAVRILANWAQGADRFFDMGANFGFFSYWLLSCQPNIQVDAFDPLPVNVEFMMRTRDRNGLAQRFEVNACALGDAREKCALHVGTTNLGHSTLAPHPGLGEHTLEVSVLPFDEWRQQSGIPWPSQPRWVAKIDVEGFEVRVLKGMQEALTRRVFKGLMIEINTFTLNLMGARPEDIYSILEGWGYVAQTAPKRRRFSEEICYNAFFEPVNV